MRHHQGLQGHGYEDYRSGLAGCYQASVLHHGYLDRRRGRRAVVVLDRVVVVEQAAPWWSYLVSRPPRRQWSS